MFAVLLTDVGLSTAALGFLAILRPLPIPVVRTRARAAATAAAGMLLTMVALMLPAPLTTIPRPASALDRFTPAYQFNEVHSIRVQASPGRAYQAIKEVTAREIRLFNTLTWLRRFGRPLPAGILNASPHRPLLEVATTTTFVTLADTPQEIVVGTVVIPAPGAGTRAPAAHDFVALRTRPGIALATMSFAIEPAPDGTCVVSTETRVYATDASARRRFAAYWRIIYPGSALIRRMWLRAIRLRAEEGM